MSDRLRIALDYRPALLGRSGVPRAARELGRVLSTDTRIECRNFGHAFAAARVPPPAGTRLFRLPIPGRLLPSLARIGLTTERLVRGADLVHWTDFVLPPVGPNTPVVFTAHDLASFEHPDYHGAGTEVLRRRTELAVRRANRIVTPTATITRALTEHLAVPPDRVATIPWGIDHDGRWPERSPADRGHLLCVGTIEPRKHHLPLLRAWRRLGSDRPPLRILGKLGWEAERIAEALTGAASDGPLEWRRTASDKELESAFRGARGLIYLSSYEGFGFPPLEALARGLPVLIGSAEACRELTGDESITCDPAEDDSVLDGLQRLLAAPTDDAAAERRIRRARAFDWSTCADRYVEVYQEVAS